MKNLILITIVMGVLNCSCRMKATSQASQESQQELQTPVDKVGKNITIEGYLQMYLLSNEGEGDRFLNTVRQTI